MPSGDREVIEAQSEGKSHGLHKPGVRQTQEAMSCPCVILVIDYLLWGVQDLAATSLQDPYHSCSREEGVHLQCVSSANQRCLLHLPGHLADLF